MTERREQLAEQATDYVLEHGLLGLSLRPLAAALGTSDRMLLYHFRDKDDLVATVLRTSNDRSVAVVRVLGPSADAHSAVLDLWRTVNSAAQARCQRLYVEAAALGVLGTEPYRSVVSEANAHWLGALADHLTASGVPRRSSRRAATLVDATFMGLQLDQQVDGGQSARRGVRDLAEAVTSIWPPRAAVGEDA
ncbi:MAG: TetR/AcrR family transcriptional regulator [Actinomycetota bacterium]|nr:TetR/AcrR family transcriptional regulator [Actinomycetota bacterium]